jgi:hypothetical protein
MSMTLDRVFVHLAPDQIRALLVALANRFDDGFTTADAEQFFSRLAASSADDDLLIEPIVAFQGSRLPFAIDAFKGESALVELVFLTPPVLADLVETELRVIGDVSMRRVSTEPGVAR